MRIINEKTGMPPTNPAPVVPSDVDDERETA
jgi:hypothetical protein